MATLMPGKSIGRFKPRAEPAPPQTGSRPDGYQTTLRSLIDILQSNVALLEIVKQRLAATPPPANVRKQVDDILAELQKLLEDMILIGLPDQASFISRKSDIDRRLIEAALRAPATPSRG